MWVQAGRMQGLRRLGAAYQRAHAHAPLLTQCTAAGVIATLGDSTMQMVEREAATADEDQAEAPDKAEPTAWEAERTGRLVLYRSLLFAPGYTLWLGLLERGLGAGTGAGIIVKKVLLDQLIWTPPSMLTLYSWMGLTEHICATEYTMDADTLAEGARLGWERARQCLWPTLQVNWPVWGVVGCITFGLVPVHLRVIWVSVVQVGWNAFLSGLNERTRQSKTAGGATAGTAADKNSSQPYCHCQPSSFL
jgi:protein Mpv17